MSKKECKMTRVEFDNLALPDKALLAKAGFSEKYGKFGFRYLAIIGRKYEKISPAAIVGFFLAELAAVGYFSSLLDFANLSATVNQGPWMDASGWQMLGVMLACCLLVPILIGLSLVLAKLDFIELASRIRKSRVLPAKVHYLGTNASYSVFRIEPTVDVRKKWYQERTGYCISMLAEYDVGFAPELLEGDSKQFETGVVKPASMLVSWTSGVWIIVCDDLNIWFPLKGNSRYQIKYFPRFLSLPRDN